MKIKIWPENRDCYFVELPESVPNVLESIDEWIKENLKNVHEWGEADEDYEEEWNLENVELKENEVLCRFTAVWDGGELVVSSDCIVNVESRIVVRVCPYIGMNDPENPVSHLDKEFVTIDGIDYPAYPEEEYDGVGFCY